VPARYGQSPVLCADALGRVANYRQMLNAHQHIPVREGMTVGYLEADPKLFANQLGNQRYSVDATVQPTKS
jgi:hypothetical protein